MAPLLPIEIKLPERELLGGGAMFVVLRTLDELEAFWHENYKWFPYAAKGKPTGDSPSFLNEYEWVFAHSKAAVVETVCRWDQVGIKVEWYDWANSEPDEHASFIDSLYLDREEREEMVEKNQWGKTDELKYQENCKKYRPDTYRGWWILTNLPANWDFLSWLSSFTEEINDPHLPPETVSWMLKVQTFDDWKDGHECDGEIEFHDERSIADEITYWRSEQLSGHDYYGRENEVLAPSKPIR